MNTVDFKPSQVFLNSVPPLIDTMGHAEREAAAALLVLACQLQGDEWKAKTPQEIGDAINRALEEGIDPWKSLARNPFFRPNFQDLVEGGFASGTLERGTTLEFTEKGLEALRKWVQP